MARILILVGTWARHDAVGQDVSGMRAAFEAAGHDVGVHTTDASEVPDAPLVPDPTSWIEDKATTVILHHTWHWPEGWSWFHRARGRRILRYHGSPDPRRHRGFPADHARALRAFWDAGPLMVGRSDVLAPVSTCAAGRLWRWGAPRRSIHVVPPFLRDGPKPIKPLAPGPPVRIVTVSRLAAQKGHVEALPTVQHLVQRYGRDITFRWVGSHAADGTAERVATRARELGVEEHLELTGALPARDVDAAYADAHLVWVLSRSEGFCVPIVEAQRCGRPVVANPVDAVPETVGAGGVLAAVGREAAAAIERLLSDGDLRGRLVHAGQENAARFAHARTAQRWADVLAATEGRRRPRRRRLRRWWHEHVRLPRRRGATRSPRRFAP